jgi:hypothetical protein
MSFFFHALLERPVGLHELRASLDRCFESAGFARGSEPSGVERWTDRASGRHEAVEVGIDGQMRTSNENFTMVGKSSELAGDIDGLDWFQYFSPRLARAWSMEYLRRGPFFRVEGFEDGAVSIFLAANPFVRYSRRTAADYLGIRLRPVLGRNPVTGAQFVIPWD